MEILDFGCGGSKTEGTIGIDRLPLSGVDVVYDLDMIPYPFQPINIPLEDWIEGCLKSLYWVNEIVVIDAFSTDKTFEIVKKRGKSQTCYEASGEAKDYPIILKPNVSQQELNEIYNRSMIYWHATGLHIDGNEYPEKMEHFGITTIEAMAHGIVPVVINRGAQPEIIKHGVNGFLGMENQLLDIL